MKFSVVALSAILLGSATLASAATLVDRALPSSVNVNNAAGANRSNVSWANQDGFVNGDSFVTGDWVIDAITVWAVGSSTAFNNYQLYTSVNGSNFVPLAAVPTVTQAFYQPSSGDPCSGGSGVSYQNAGGSCSPIIQMRFSGLNLAVSSGDLFHFAPDATPLGNCVVGGDISGCFFVHATNAALAGVVQQQSNNLYISFDPLAGGDGDPQNCDSGAPLGPVCNGGWDKSSDINVLVEGTVVIPEPSTFALIAIGVGALALLRRRR